jgi:CheY-like chemotaxis protein
MDRDVSAVRDSSFSLPVHALLVDDDEDWTEATKELLEGEGIGPIVFARSAEEASLKLKEREYQLVLVDRNLEQARIWGRRPAQGDEWLLSSLPQIGTRSVAALVTAYPRQIRYREALERQGVKIVIKSSVEEIKDLQGLAATARASHESRQRAERPGELSTSIGERVGKAAAQLFTEWLETRPNKDEKATWIGNRLLSFEDLANEIQAGTDLGSEVLEMFIEHVRLRIGMAKL